MKTENNTPSNSLVEVTIIQHNKSDQHDNPHKILANKIPLQLESNSTNSESASQKRRNWFKRVITKPNGVSSQAYLKTTTELYKKSYLKYTQESLDRYYKQKNKKPRKNFVTILPDEIPIDTDYQKGYRRVSPEKKTPIQKKKTALNPLKKETVGLARKFSDVFLPSKRSDKKKAMKSALTALKNEVDITKVKEDHDKGQIKDKTPNRVPKRNFGKIVDNILGGIMETSKNNEIGKSKANTLPFPYQKYFEPVSKPKVKPLPKKKKMRTRKKLTNSHSDTCCVNFKEEFSGPKLKKSNSTSNCKEKKLSNRTPSYNSGDLKRSQTGTEKLKRSKKRHRRNEKGDVLTQSSSNDKIVRGGQRKKPSIHSQNSMIEWNGQKIRVNKEIKTRIEMIIVNELQNLALKEGMECDVTPLPSTDTGSNSAHSIEKVSSFVCELDISDKKIKKLIKNKKSSEKKINVNKSSHVDDLNSCQEGKIENKVEIFYKEEMKSVIKSVPKEISQENVVIESQNISINPGTSNTEPITNMSPTDGTPDDNKMEITYVNKRANNWSDESTSFKFRSLGKKLPGGEIETFASKDTVFTFGEENKPSDKAVSTGFVKKIDSNDSTWKNFSNARTASSGQLVNLAVSTTKSTIIFSSTTTHEYATSIEIELDIKDLESLLKEAKQKQQSGKVLVNARCNQENKQKKAIKLSGKNSPSYTERLLKDASQKLAKYTKTVRK